MTGPTAGLDVQACLDIGARRAEVAQERVRQAALEARRRMGRVDATLPDLDDPAPTSQLKPLHVVVEQGTSRPTP